LRSATTSFWHSDAVRGPSTPTFSYVQLLFAGLLGFGIFGTVPGAMTLVGGLVIAASGLYTAHREHIRAREARLAAAGIYRS